MGVKWFYREGGCSFTKIAPHSVAQMAEGVISCLNALLIQRKEGLIYMDVSTTAFLEKFLRNILSYKDVDDPDAAEIAIPMRYFLTYLANGNRIYERQVQIQDLYIRHGTRMTMCTQTGQ